MELGEKLQSIRKSHNLSQSDLAEKLDISHQSVSKWETGTATPELSKLILSTERVPILSDSTGNQPASCIGYGQDGDDACGDACFKSGHFNADVFRRSQYQKPGNACKEIHEKQEPKSGGPHHFKGGVIPFFLFSLLLLKSFRIVCEESSHENQYEGEDAQIEECA